MQACSIPILFTLFLSHLLAACGTNSDVAPDGPPTHPLTTIGIIITSEQARTHVAFRDGLDAPWAMPDKTTDSSFYIKVHGPYVVTVVCEDVSGHAMTLQFARTPSDGYHFSVSCDLPAAMTSSSTMIAPDGVKWGIEHDQQTNHDQISVSWTTLPELDHLELSASGTAVSDTTQTTHKLSMTPLFLKETGITKIAIDTVIPNYDCRWGIDFHSPYTLALTAARW